MDLDYIIGYLESQKNNAQVVLEEFSQKLVNDDPAYEMEWADKIFQAAARVEFATQWLNMVDRNSDHDPQDVVEHLVNNARRRMVELSRSCTNQSTSPSSNAMKMYRLEEVARFVDDFGKKIQ